MMNTQQLADTLEGTSAEAVLLELPLQGFSYCRGSDHLVELGLWNNDGEQTDFCQLVKKELQLRRQH